MAGGLNEEQAAVDTGILNVALTLSSELLAKVCGVLILDILDNRVPANATSVPVYNNAYRIQNNDSRRISGVYSYQRSLLTWSP